MAVQIERVLAVTPKQEIVVSCGRCRQVYARGRVFIRVWVVGHPESYVLGDSDQSVKCCGEEKFTPLLFGSEIEAKLILDHLESEISFGVRAEHYLIQFRHGILSSAA